LLQALQLVHGLVEGAFLAGLHLRELRDEGHVVLVHAVLPHHDVFADFGAQEPPVRYGHIFEQELLGGSLGLPFGFQIVTQFVKCLGVFGGQDRGAGAETVF
jgi:hypothetical protein